ncbi:biotin transporter BioY, partial [Yaniella sp.]
MGLVGSITLAGGVPITLQSLGVMLAGAVLGPWRGAASMGLLILGVAIGLPLLAGGRGGIGVFVSPTAGYLIGYVIAPIV